MCHTPMGPQGPDMARAFAGGNPMELPPMFGTGTLHPSNITSDKATGLGSYSDEDIKRALTDGKNKAGRYLYVMPWSYYAGMTDADKDALIAALREVPPIANMVPAATVK